MTKTFNEKWSNFLKKNLMVDANWRKLTRKQKNGIFSMFCLHFCAFEQKFSPRTNQNHKLITNTIFNQKNLEIKCSMGKQKRRNFTMFQCTFPSFIIIIFNAEKNVLSISDKFCHAMSGIPLAFHLPPLHSYRKFFYQLQPFHPPCPIRPFH